MGELVGSSETYSTWGKFRAPLSNVDTYYGFMWTAEFPVWVGNEFNKEYRGGQFCYTEISFCYPPGWFITEHGGMLRVIPYSPFGWSGAGISYSEYPSSQYYYGPQMMSIYMDEADFGEMLGATLTSDVGSEVVDLLSKTGQQVVSNQGAGWYAIEKLQPLT